MCLGEIRLDSDDLLEGSYRFQIAAKFAVGIAKIIVSGGVIRLDYDGLFIGFYLILPAAKFAVGNAKITVCIGVIRLDSDGLLIGFYRILITAKFEVGKAKTIVCLGIIRLDSDCLFIEFYLILPAAKPAITIPKSLAECDDESESDVPFRLERPSPQDELDAKIFTAWRDLFSIFFDKHIIGWDWEQYICSILGIGFANIEGRGSDVLQNQLLESVQHLRQSIVNAQSDGSRNVEHWWPYLQLIGAWTSGFSVEEAGLSEEIAEEVGRLKPFRSFMHGYSGDSRFEPYGYPTVFYTDFFLPRPSNLVPQGYITGEDKNQFIRWQASLMSSELLLAYHKEVEKTRAPLREEFYKRLRERREERENREQTKESEHPD